MSKIHFRTQIIVIYGQKFTKKITQKLTAMGGGQHYGQPNHIYFALRGTRLKLRRRALRNKMNVLIHWFPLNQPVRCKDSGTCLKTSKSWGMFENK